MYPVLFSAVESVVFYAIAAAVVIASVGVAGAIAMGKAIVKSIESIARQPEADGKIRGAMILGLVFVETVVIYALVISILLVIKVLG